ncbi:NlpC/P60 family protein [Halarcobacter sp.]|uniref:NlpC/P60 family protein n=1 Tax=Halarcobacter sp. TaxID=2321133 RepID=UPI0029F50B6A|nr:NlpC/P60 family protein [Halarcobacter sp.]
MIKNLLLIILISITITGCVFNNQKFVLSDKNDYTIHEENPNLDKNLITNLEYKAIVSNNEYKKILQKPKRNLEKEEQLAYIEKALMEFYSEWKGVKYKFGGDTKKGIDCSAFTQKIFKEKFQLDIPRTTRTQVKVGTTVKKSELKLGDLVFFKTGRIDRHVGVYIGNGEFMHASIKGVKVTKLNKPFYKKAYWTSKRVIN